MQYLGRPSNAPNTMFLAELIMNAIFKKGAFLSSLQKDNNVG